MPLTGLERPTARPRGGVASIRIVPSSAVTKVAYDAARGRIDGIDFSVPPVRWNFREDGAEYREALTGELPLNPLVKHTLTVEIPAGRAADHQVRELLAGCRVGFAVLVEMASGEYFLAGWSRKFGTGYPLRVAKITSATGRTPGDLPSLEITLESTDCEFSLHVR